MRFIVSTSTLLKHLQTVQGALSSNTVMPILENFLFEIKDGQLVISATDLQTSMTTSLPIEAKEDGKVAVPSKILLDALKTLPDQPISFQVDENLGIEISAGDGKYRLIGEHGIDFPKIPTIENASSVNIPASVLSDAISKTIFAVSSDELRPAMTGVFCQLSPQDITFVATDAHKLVKYCRKDTRSEETSSFILPKKALSLLKSALPNEDINVNIDYNTTSAFFKFNNVTLICRLIDERYPDYTAVIPKENPNRLVVDRALFLNCLRRVSIFSSKATYQVRIKITGSELHISTEDLDFSNAANERLTCQYDGEDMEIGFNSKFLIEMLNILSGEEITLAMSTSNRPGLLIPHTNDEHEDVTMLVMPVMISNN